jgi:hypothetical protein
MAVAMPGQKKDVVLADAGLVHWPARRAKWCHGLEDLAFPRFFEIIDAASPDYS